MKSMLAKLKYQQVLKEEAMKVAMNPKYRPKIKLPKVKNKEGAHHPGQKRKNLQLFEKYVGASIEELQEKQRKNKQKSKQKKRNNK